MYFRCILYLLKTLNCNCNVWKFYLRNVSERGREKRERGEVGTVRGRVGVMGRVGVRGREGAHPYLCGGEGVITWPATQVLESTIKGPKTLYNFSA